LVLSVSLSYVCCWPFIDPCLVRTCIVALDLGCVVLGSVILVVEMFVCNRLPSNSFSVHCTFSWYS